MGQQLELVRDPNNPYGRNAVKVYRPDGKQPGFIAARAAEDIGPCLDAGLDVEAVVTEITGGTPGKPTVGVNLLIAVYDKEEPAEGAFAAPSATIGSIYSTAPGAGSKFPMRRCAAGPSSSGRCLRRSYDAGSLGAKTLYLDEVFLRMNGRRVSLWRAVDEHGQVLDTLVQERRDAHAAERFFRRLLVRSDGAAPERIITDQLASYAVAKRRIPALDTVQHVHVRAAARLNNRIEQSHQSTRVRERRMQRFKSPAQAQRFLTAFSFACNLFRVRRHLLTATDYRSTMRDRFQTWREVTPLGSV